MSYIIIGVIGYVIIKGLIDAWRVMFGVKE